MTQTISPGRIVQISISAGGVPKLPVERAALGPLGLDGDKHRDRRNHGGPTRALCLYGIEQIRALRAEGHTLVPGAIGENLTTEGIDIGALRPGDRLQIGDDMLIEITGYTTPCQNIAPWFVDERIARVSAKVNPGWSRVYARVLQGGEVYTGQPIRVLAPATIEAGRDGG
jgi:MOSC domain-containing protein YiiM